MFDHSPQDAISFRDTMLASCIQALKINTFLDNFDHVRFGSEPPGKERVFHATERAYWFTWFFENAEKLFSAMQILDSEADKVLFQTLIGYRLVGHHGVRIPVPFDSKLEESVYLRHETSSPSSLSLSGMFGELRHFDFVWEGISYVGDCLGFSSLLYRRQYYLDRGAFRVQPEYGDYVIDAGACLGDTSIVFGKSVGPNGKVFAFDPVQDHLEVLRFNITQNSGCNIESIPYGLSNIEVEAAPIRLNGYSGGFSSRNQTVPLTTIDSLVIDGKIPKVDFIKMDIEGAELSAIIGALGTIRKFRPKLAISLYHKPSDLFEIPIYLRESFPNYKFFLEHYTIHSEETVLYAVPQE